MFLLNADQELWMRKLGNVNRLQFRFKTYIFPRDLKLRKLIFLSILLTLPISVFYALNYTARLDLQSVKNIQFGKTENKFSEEILDELSFRISDEEYIGEFIEQKSIEEIAKYAELLFISKVESKQKAAASLSRRAGIKYRSPPLLYRAARYSMAAPIRDYGKALEILNIEYVAGDGLADYFRGLIWQDAANPDRDLEKARTFFEKARDAGIPAAQKMLLNLDARAKGSSSLRK